MNYRRLVIDEIPEALGLIWKTFMVFKVYDMSLKGINTFRQSLGFEATGEMEEAEGILHLPMAIKIK